MKLVTLDRGLLRRQDEARYEREMRKFDRMIWFFLGATSGAIIMLTVIYFAAWVSGVKI